MILETVQHVAMIPQHVCVPTYLVTSDSLPLQAGYNSLPGSSVHGIFQARILEQVGIFYSRGHLLYPGKSLTSPALAGRFFTISATWEALISQRE